MTNKEVERRVQNTVATLAMEGMYCTSDEISDLWKISLGELDPEDAVRSAVKKYREN